MKKYVRSLETRRRLSLSKMGSKNPQWGKHRTKKEKEYLSKIQTKLKTGLKPSKATRIKIALALKGRFMNSDNPNWRGGTSKRHPSARCFTPQWRELRETIYRRDKRICQCCFKKCKKKEIQCHHKIPHHISLDDSPNNLITVCHACHKYLEKQFYINHPEHKKTKKAGASC